MVGIRFSLEGQCIHLQTACLRKKVGKPGPLQGIGQRLLGKAGFVRKEIHTAALDLGAVTVENIPDHDWPRSALVKNILQIEVALDDGAH